MFKFFLLKIIVFFIVVASLVSCTGNYSPVHQLQPNQGSNIIFIGNTFAERMQHFNYFETLLHKSFPDHHLTIRNLGWSGDEVSLQPRPLNFNSLDWHLHQQKADIIFVSLGMNESFKGAEHLEKFKNDLFFFLQHLKQQYYNGEKTPEIILISPIAHEKLGENFPDPAPHNKNLKLYTEGMEGVARSLRIPFIDLFEPTHRLMRRSSEPLTINGIHLNDKGYKEISSVMGRALDLVLPEWQEETEMNQLRKAINEKNKIYFYDYRAVNGEYIYGRRKKPFGVVSFPAEFSKLKIMAKRLDSLIWEGSRSGAFPDFKKIQEIINDTVQFKFTPPLEKSQPSTEQFIIQEGYEINLFASEIDFPIENPVTLTFDPQGRMWIATMPSYPHYFPGSPPNDKIIILEDTNKDGKADKHTIFADSLYLPLGFELGDGGVYVTQPPNLMFLKDTNGDGYADHKEIVFHGFGTEDSHHAISSYTWGPDGAIYMHEGTFLHTQVETPYGPVRGAYGTTYRFEPRSRKLQAYVSYPYANPWGNVFTREGIHFIGDASDGKNYYATPLTVAIEYPKKHLAMKDFPDTKVRPTSGLEIVASRHFPQNAQGNLLVNNNIGFQGIKQYQVFEEGSGVAAKEVENLLQSKDLNFRPVDLQFGPDGALYIVDWFNPLIGHMQHSLRDPGRDHSHGRIWKITHKENPLLQPVDLSKLSIEELLDQLKIYEDRARYRVRIQLREFPKEKVLSALNKWQGNLDPNDPDYDHLLMEALWVHQQFGQPNEKLLELLLSNKNHQIRAAATKVLFYWNDQIKGSFQKLQKMANDSSSRVRLEAIAALSHFNTEESVKKLLSITELPVDYYIDYALKESFKHLQPVWMAMFEKDKDFLKDEPEKAHYLLHPLSSRELLAMPDYFFRDDPARPIYERHAVSPENLNYLSDATAVVRFYTTQKNLSETSRKEGLDILAQRTGKDVIDVLLEEIIRLDKQDDPQGLQELITMLADQDPGQLKNKEVQFAHLSSNADKIQVKAFALAAMADSPEGFSQLWEMAQKSPENLKAFINSARWCRNEALHGKYLSKIKIILNGSHSTGLTNEEQHEVKLSAIEILPLIKGNHSKTMALLNNYLQPNGKYAEEAAMALLAFPEDQLPTVDLMPLKNSISRIINSVPERERIHRISNSMVRLGHKVAAHLPQPEKDDLLLTLSMAEKTVINIATQPEKMLFDKESFIVAAGKAVELIFTNPDNMPHNLLITKPNTLEEVGMMAEEMAKSPDGFKRNFVPDTDNVLFATPLLNSGQSFTLKFIAPDTPGEYPFVCTFPGHWQMMNGIMKVEKQKIL